MQKFRQYEVMVILSPRVDTLGYHNFTYRIKFGTGPSAFIKLKKYLLLVKCSFFIIIDKYKATYY